MTDRSSSSSALAAVVMALAFALPVLWRGRFLVANSATAPVGDQALIELATRRTLEGEQLVGPYSRFLWHHPGPLYFQWLAPFYRVLGPVQSSLQIGALTLQTLAAVGILIVVHRYGAIYAAWTFLALTVFFHGLGGRIASTWNPEVTILPMALFVVLAAAHVTGARRLAGFLVLVGSFLVQTHVGYLPTVVALSLAVMPFRRSAGAASPPGSRMLTAIVLAALWLLPLYEELTAEGGNLTRLATFLWRSGGVHHGWGESLGIVLQRIGAAWLPDAASASAVLLGATLVAAMAITALRARERFARRLAMLTLVSVATAIFGTTRIVGTIESHLVAWIAVVGLVAAIAVGSSLLSRLAESPWAASTSGMLAACALALHLASQRGPLPVVEPIDGTVAGIADETRARLAAAGAKRPLVRILTTEAWPQAAGVVLLLVKAGVPVSVERGWAFAFGDHLAEREDYDSTLVFVTPKVVVGGEDSEFVRLESGRHVNALFAVHRDRGAALRAALEIAPGDRRAAAALSQLRAGASGDDIAELDRRFMPTRRTDLPYGGEILLLGYDWETIDAARARIVYYWMAIQQTVWNYAAFVHFDGPGFRFQDDHFIGEPDALTGGWPSDVVHREERVIAVPPGAPPGNYEMRVGVWEPNQRLYLQPSIGESKRGVVVTHLEVPLR